MWRKKDEKIKRIEAWNIGNYNNAGNGGEARAVPEQCERRRSARALLGHWSGNSRLSSECWVIGCHNQSLILYNYFFVLIYK